MDKVIQKAKAIYAGYEWVLQVTITGHEPFPSTARFRAQARPDPSSEALATITSEDGEIERVSANAVRIKLPGAKSLGWTVGTVMMDLVRTDTPAEIHMGFVMTIPVRIPITSPA